MADTADHAWTIAMATGSTPLPPHSPPLRHSGGGLNVAARHVLLSLYLHHRALHLPDQQLPAPQAAAPTPEAWADTAPEEIAAYLQITCRRFNTALGQRKRNTLSTQRIPLPGTPPHPHAAEAPGGLDVLSGTPTWPPPTRPPPRGWTSRTRAPTSEALRHTSERRIAGTPAPRRPHGDKQFTRPRHPPGREDQHRSGGPPAHPPAGHGARAKAQVKPHRDTPNPDPRGTPTAPSPPAPTSTSVPQHPNPAAQPATTARTTPHHARTTIHAEPGDMAPPTPPPRPLPSQPLPPDAPILHATPTSYIPTRPKHKRAPRTTHPTSHISPHHTITYTTTTSPYHRTRQRRDTTHNRHTLITPTTRSSTTHGPHYTSS